MTLYDSSRFTFVVATMVLSLAGSIVSATTIGGGWISATVLNVALDAPMIAPRFARAAQETSDIHCEPSRD